MSSSKTKTIAIPPFTLSSEPGRDVWAKPPSHRVMTAPTHPAPLPSYPLNSFQRARLTFSLPQTNELRQYDQAGLFLHFSNPTTGAEKWLKTGIEYYYGKPYVSTVGCDNWADWSVAPLTPFQEGGRPSTTVEAKREKDVLGKSMWVYQLNFDEQEKEVDRRPLREVNWIFAEEDGWIVSVGGYACRPTEEGGQGKLEVQFEKGVEIEVLDG